MTATIRLDHNQVQSVNIAQFDDDDQNSGKIIFNYEVFFSTENKKQFAVSFETTVTTELVVLDVNYVSYFVTEEDIQDSEQDSKFYHINAPAIGYPFLRAYVANLMLSSGYPVYMMPTINFVALLEKKTKEAEAEKGKKSLN